MHESVRVTGVYGGLVSPFGAKFARVMKGEGVDIPFGMRGKRRSDKVKV